MATITEDYVSFETAKLLKERGFDELGDYYYTKNGEFTDCLTIGYVNGCDRVICKNHTLFPYKAPTLQMACKWLREVHNIHIIAEPCLGEGNEPNLSFNRWFWTILKEEGEYKPIRKIDEFTNYEQACEAAIKYCLEHLI